MSIKATKIDVKNKVLLPRSGHKIVADDNYLYVIGGYVERKLEGLLQIDTNEVRGEIWRLHFVYKTWEKCNFDKEIFTLGASHSAVKHGDCIFITGGTGFPFGLNILNHVIVVDTRNMTQNKYVFQPRDNLCRNLPIATYGHSVTYAVVDKRPCLYLMGGTTGTTYHREVYQIDLISLQSVLVSDGSARHSPPQPRYKHEAFLWRDKIYMLGGTTQSNVSFSLDEIHVFELATHEWSHQAAGSPIGMELRCPSMCQNGQYIYVTGGQRGDGSISSQIYQLDLATVSWTTIGHWDRPCYFHDSAFVPQLGSVFMFGGVCRYTPAERTNELYQFLPATGRVAPSLTDLAWRELVAAVIRMRAAGSSSDGDCGVDDAFALSQDLRRMGIPSSIISRIYIRHCGAGYAA